MAKAKRSNPAAQPMFTLLLDIGQVFVPPMKESSNGICLTRKLELPFAPFNGLSLNGAELREVPEWSGHELKDITWDIDRQVFLAKAKLIHVNLPIPYIADEIRSWLNRGWKLGSFEELYEADYEAYLASDETPVKPQEASDGKEAIDDNKEQWPSLPPKERPAHFNKLLMALVRQLAVEFSNLPTAYAMDKTKMYFTDEALRETPSPATEKFVAARDNFARLSRREQIDWAMKVAETHPRMDRVLKRRRG
jgi:hypothetical protein